MRTEPTGPLLRPTPMRSVIVTRTAVGVGAAALTVAGSLLIGGSSPGARAAATPAALTTSDSCATLLRWYVDHTIGEVGPYGWNGYGWMERRMMTDAAAGSVPSAATGSSTAATGTSASATGTNVQEAGVDEPDVAKTDGRLVVRLLDQRRVRITDVSGPTPKELGSWTLPRTAYADGLLLVGHHVLVTAQTGMVAVPASGVAGSGGSLVVQPAPSPRTDVWDLDITDPTAPRLATHTSWSGRSVSLRQYGDVVRLVTDTGLPDLPFVQPRDRGDAAARRRSEADAVRHNRQLVAQSTIADWLPSVSRDGATKPAMACSDVLHPEAVAASPSGISPGSTTDTLGVFTWRPGSAVTGAPVAITGAGTDVYSSGDHLYLWSTDWVEHVAPQHPGVQAVRPTTSARTTLHEFALAGESTRYVASGQVEGLVRDRWSLDEYAGHLRVALSYPRQYVVGPISRVTPGVIGSGGDMARPAATDNGVVVLATQGDLLVQIGVVRGLGRGEDIQAVRWLDALAVLVTYRQTDPVFALDLSDPTAPRTLGELRLPGYSGYLHPIGDDRLLGLGVAGASIDTDQRAKISVFDLAHPTDPRELGRQVLASDSRLGGAGDPHDVTWIPGSVPGTGEAVTSVEHDGSGTPTMLAIRVAPDGRVTSEPLPSPGGFDPRALPLPDGRIALVGTHVQVVRASAG